MAEIVYESARVDNSQIMSIDRKKVAAVSIATEGAMGTPGDVRVFFAGDDCIVEWEGNYVYSDFDIETLSARLRLSTRGPKAWVEYYLGMGNTLLVNARDYPELDATLSLNQDDVPFIFRTEIWLALSSRNDVMSELRSKIEAEMHEHITRDTSANEKTDGSSMYDDEFGLPISVRFAVGKGPQKDIPPELQHDIPDHRRIYLNEMDATPDALCVEKETGWAKMICVKKADFPKLLSLWYPNGTGDWDWQQLLDFIVGDLVWINGFGD